MSRAEAVAELKATWCILSDDVDEIEELFEERGTPTLFRTLIRDSSACYEGLLYQLRQVALKSARDHPTVEVFSPEEMTFLQEEKISTVSGTMRHADARKRMLCTLRLYGKIHGISFAPDTSGDGWEAMTKFIKVRNRLMHPEGADDLTVDEESHQCFFERADTWFYDTTTELLKQCYSADQKYTQGVEASSPP